MAHSDFDGDIEELAEDHEKTERGLLAIVIAYLSGQMLLEEAEAEIDAIAAALREAVEGWVREVAPAIYTDGVQEALSALSEAPQSLTPDLHDASLDLLSEDLSADLLATQARMSEDAKTSLREIARRQIGNMMATGSNAIPQAAKMEAELRERGVAFTDRSGRRWKPRAYSEMALRTHAVKISNQANVNAAKEIGSRFVRISDGGPGDVDQPCLDAAGQIWSLDYFQANLLQHPNCRRSGAPMPSTYSGRVDRS